MKILFRNSCTRYSNLKNQYIINGLRIRNFNNNSTLFQQEVDELTKKTDLDFGNEPIVRLDSLKKPETIKTVYNSRNNFRQERTASKISNFLVNVGQAPIQNKEKYFLVNCPNCSNESVSSSTKSFVEPYKGDFYCAACTSKSTWDEFKDRTMDILQQSKLDVCSRNNLDQPCIETLKDFSLKDLKDKPNLLNQLFGKPKVLKEETMRKYWLSWMWKESIPVEDSDKPTYTPYLILPRTSPSSSNPYSTNHKFHMTSFKAITPVDIKLKFEEPSIPSPPGFFGYHLTSENDNAVVITWKEEDAMAVYQATGIPAISLPREIYQLPIEYMPLLAKFKKVYLWFDGDVQSQNAAQSFARKLGLDRTYLIRTESQDGTSIRGPFRALKQGKDLNRILKEAKLHTHNQVLNFDSLKHSVLLEVMYADQVRGVPSLQFPGLNAMLKGLRPGELTIFTGPTGSGKTTFLSQLSLDYCQSGVPTLWGSFEIANTRLIKKMVDQLANEKLDSVDSYLEWADQFSKLPMYFMKFFGSTKVEDVLSAMEHAVHAYDVQHVIIDNLQFMTSGLKKGFERFEYQDEALSAFRHFATQFNVHVTLVVHPRKDPRELLDMQSVFGSAKVTQEADNVIILQNGVENTRLIDVRKNRFDGTIGMEAIKYDPATGRSTPLTQQEQKEIERRHTEKED